MEAALAHLRGRERARYVAYMFGRISRRYDRLNTIMTAGRHYAWRKSAVDLVCAGGMRGPALDLATGTGDFAIELARRPDVSEVIGLDFAPQMLPIARRKTWQRGLDGGVQYIVGDAHALPFSDDTFAAAAVGFGVRNFVDVPRAMTEAARVLKPGGRIAVLEIVPLEGRGLLRRLVTLYFRRVTPWIGSLFAGDREAYTYLPESVQGFLTVSALERVMSEAGLRPVAVKRTALGSVAIVVGEKAGNLDE